MLFLHAFPRWLFHKITILPPTKLAKLCWHVFIPLRWSIPWNQIFETFSKREDLCLGESQPFSVGQILFSPKFN
jgi:hypothetical protein